MKPLVYTTAFGDARFFALAEEMARSLRLRGYEDDLVVIADRAFPFPRQLRVDVRVLEAAPGPRFAKVALPRLMDVSAYDRMLFVDTDVVFLRHPEPLFALAGSKVTVSRDHYPLRRNVFNLSFCDRALRASGLYESRSLNTGVVAFPVARLAPTLERWERVWRDGLREKNLQNRPAEYAELRDQPALQRMALETPDEFGYIPDELLLMPLFFSENQPLHPEAVLVHLNGASRSADRKERILSLMRDFNAANAHADFRRLCDALQAGRPRFDASRTRVCGPTGPLETTPNIRSNNPNPKE